MRNQELLKEIVTVTEMARMCGLSRARFYQLIGEGVFPTPSRSQETKRPFFDREQQEQCLLVRRTNRGANGKAVMFYGCCLEPRPEPARKRKPFPKRKLQARQTSQESVITELRHGLAQLGMTNLTDADIREALVEAYPDGHRDVESAELLRAVFGAIQRRNSADNLSG